MRGSSERRGLALAAALAAALFAGASFAQDEPSIAKEISPDAEKVLEGGLAYLAHNQAPDGSLGESTNKSFRLATTSLAGLAWLAAGSTPTRGRHKEELKKAIEYVVAQRDSERIPLTYFGKPAHDEAGRMHAHGMALLFLAESYGMFGRGTETLAAEVKDTIEGAVKVSVAAQTAGKGGWGYLFAGESDYGFDEASTTITQIQGLRAARNAGFTVDSRCIDRAVKYVKSCVGEKGDCCYSLTMADGTRTSFELTAAAVATLNAAGTYGGEKLDRALDYLRRQIKKRSDKPTAACENYFYYGNLYAAQAMFQAGGADWASWWRGAQDDLVNLAQKEMREGEVSWKEDRGFGDAYATASVCLILAIPYRYLPIFER